LSPTIKQTILSQGISQSEQTANITAISPNIRFQGNEIATAFSSRKKGREGKGREGTEKNLKSGFMTTVTVTYQSWL